MIEGIKNIKWYDLKAQSIDLGSDFCRFDDVIFKQSIKFQKRLIKVENNLEEMMKSVRERESSISLDLNKDIL